MNSPTVVLGRSGVLRLRKGHPWIFSDHIDRVQAADGDVVRLEGPAGTPRGVAVYSDSSRLPLRVVSHDPGFEASGDAWWIERLEAAIARRRAIVPVEEQGQRWVHAEADGLPGLVVDRFGPVAVTQAGCRWADAIQRPLAELLMERHGVSGVLARNDGGFRRPEGLEQGVERLAGSVPEQLEVRLGGLLRRVDPWRGQKTGTYLDQRENQVWAAGALPPGRCLDAFCNEGGFALALAAAGRTVLAIDSSKAALERLRVNAGLNQLVAAIEPRRANVFDALRAEQPEAFDGIVLDPPALAKRRPDLARATRAYRDLNLRALRLLRTGGRLITCSCSHHLDRARFRTVLAQAAVASGRQVLLLEERAAARCHPRLLGFPESDYLKLALLEVVA